MTHNNCWVSFLWNLEATEFPVFIVVYLRRVHSQENQHSHALKLCLLKTRGDVNAFIFDEKCQMLFITCHTS